jgi:hypothetical protein
VIEKIIIMLFQLFFVLLAEAIFFAILYWWADKIYKDAHAPRDKNGNKVRLTTAQKYGLEKK